MFDKKLFAELLEKAKGTNKLVDFSNMTDIDRSYLSKYLNKRRSKPLQPIKLQQIADVSDGKVTYEELMEASGYIKSKNEIILENIKLLMGNMSYKEFSKDIGEKLNDKRFEESYNPDYLNNIFTGKTKVEPMRVLSLSNYAGVDDSFFYKENTYDDLILAQKKQKEKEVEYEKLHSISNLYYQRVSELQKKGIAMHKYEILFERDNIKFLDIALQLLDEERQKLK